MLTRVPAARSGQQGLSLVELMVGITIGLFVVAAATIVSTTQLRDNRQLLLETQLQQDLRASADIMAREIRRSGFIDNAEFAVWNANAGPNVPSSTQSLAVTAGAAGQIVYDYKRPDNAPGPFQYGLDNGVIKVRLSANSPTQDLTDRNVMFVEALTIDLQQSPEVRLECPSDCPGGITPDYCWPLLRARELVITITGRAARDPAVRRSIESRVHLRNDAVSFHPSNPSASPACPG